MNAKEGFVGKRKELMWVRGLLESIIGVGKTELYSVWVCHKEDIIMHNVYILHKVCINKSHHVWTDFAFNEKECLNGCGEWISGLIDIFHNLIVLKTFYNFYKMLSYYCIAYVMRNASDFVNFYKCWRHVIQIKRFTQI